MVKIKRHTLHRICLISIALITISAIPHSPLSAQNQKTWQWIKQLGGDSWDISSGIACDAKKNIYLAGSFINTLNCDAKSIVSSGNQDFFIARFSPDGNMKSIINGGGKNSDFATGVCVTPDNKIIICGIICDTIQIGKVRNYGKGKRLFISALEPDLAVKWMSTISIKGDAAVYLSGADKHGNIYISGVFTGTLKVENKSIISNGKKDIFLSRLNSEGIVENLYSFGSTEDDFPGSLSVESSGTFFLAGTYGKPFEINGLKLAPGPKGTMTNSFICKFDKDFNTQWINVLPGEDFCKISSLKYNNSGNLYVAGSFSSKLFVADTMLVSDGYTDGFILKYFTDGKLEWSRRFGTWYYDYISDLNVDNLGGTFITGSLGDTLIIDSLKIEPLAPGNSAIIIQFAPDGKAIWADCISGKLRNFSDGSVIDNDGNLYLTGTFLSTFGKEGDDLGSFGDQDIFLAKYYNCDFSKAEIFGRNSFCYGTGTELSIRKGFTNVVWNDTIPNKCEIIADKPGPYRVSMMDKKGCRLADTILVTQNALPQFSLGNDTTILVSDSLFLFAPGGYPYYKWNDNSDNQFYLARSVDGEIGKEDYWLTVTDSLSCNYTDTISVTYLKGNDWLNFGNEEFILYPNPASEKVFWSLKTIEPCELITELTNVDGRVLYHQYYKHYVPGELKEISLSSLKSGFYNIRFSSPSSGDIYKSARIIKL